MDPSLFRLCREVMAAVLSQLCCHVHWLHCKSLRTTSEIIIRRWWHSVFDDDDELLSDRWRTRVRHHGNPEKWISWPQFDLSAPPKESEKRRAERGWRGFKAAAAAKAAWVQTVEGMIQIWSGVSAPVAYWETRDCTVARTKCGRNRWDVDGAERENPAERGRCSRSPLI